ncbi:MAG: ORF6N domain-containing protein, partial [Desulfobacterales bacterium]|nr:ORF6N domain-containing protein [Desulfobacterales bacterium]MDX2508100.1 ORF6N domain-containing protein [Desulfobacterales bacterium]
MLSSVLKSERAVQVNIQIMRVFVKLRQLFLDNKDIRKGLEKLKKITDQRFQIVFEILDQLLSVEDRPKKKNWFYSKR